MLLKHTFVNTSTSRSCAQLWVTRRNMSGLHSDSWAPVTGFFFFFLGGEGDDIIHCSNWETHFSAGIIMKCWWSQLYLKRATSAAAKEVDLWIINTGAAVWRRCRSRWIYLPLVSRQPALMFVLFNSASLSATSTHILSCKYWINESVSAEKFSVFLRTGPTLFQCRMCH